jgi:hypothetical protein
VSIEPQADVGFVFRRGKKELVLFFEVDVAEGTFDGRNIKGLVDYKRHKQLEAWKRRYAQQELTTK